MPGDSKRSSSTRTSERRLKEARRGPRTRSMAKSEQHEEEQQSPRTGADTVATTGSDVNNNGEGSPSSNECASPVQPKKTRRVHVSEITEEADAQVPQPSAIRYESPEKANSSGSDEEELVVHFYTQYLCITLWRAIEDCKVWDYPWVKAFYQGPQAFMKKTVGIVRRLHNTISSTGQEVRPEDLTRSYLNTLRPTGLYNCGARILQNAKKACRWDNKRTLKRKKPEESAPAGAEGYTTLHDQKQDPNKFKYRFMMDPPRVYILSGPNREVLNGEDPMIVEK